MACRLIAWDKQPGVRPVGIGELLRCLLAKIILHAVGPEATTACDNLNLCAGLKAGIEGAVHALRDARDSDLADPPSLTSSDDEASDDDCPALEPRSSLFPHTPTSATPALLSRPEGILMQLENPSPVDDTGLAHAEVLMVDADGADVDDPFVVDTKNGFNELSCKAAPLWTVMHLWPAGAQFVFNCYKHSSALVLRQHNRSGAYMLGDPLSMIVYGLALVPLAQKLHDEFPAVLQPWYADDVAMEGRRASNVVWVMDRLKEAGPARGYYPKPEKSILLTAKALLERFEFPVQDGSPLSGLLLRRGR
jgi:hypothetical protein